MTTRFVDRVHAGRELAGALAGHVRADRPLVLALPRGGVPVAAEVGGELDIVVARKIGAPGQPEFGIGALAEDGSPVLDEPTLSDLGVTEADLADTISSERAEVARRAHRYRDGRPAPTVTGRETIVVDDGIATGVTARAALRWLRDQRPMRIVLAVPTCSSQAEQDLAGYADEVVCLHSPRTSTRWARLMPTSGSSTTTRWSGCCWHTGDRGYRGSPVVAFEVGTTPKTVVTKKTLMTTSRWSTCRPGCVTFTARCTSSPMNNRVSATLIQDMTIDPLTIGHRATTRRPAGQTAVHRLDTEAR